MHLLRIEGVNHAHCITDTEDLSTRRGGSLMLLDAIDVVKREFEGQLRAISTGASMGLFELLQGSPEKVAQAVRRRLRNDDLFRHGTFMVDAVEHADFPAAERTALNANRWQQMKSLSFSPVGLQPKESGPCAVDEVRPEAQKATVRARPNTGVSRSVADRRSNGIEKKQHFYALELERLPSALRPAGWNASQAYTQDFDDLASAPQVPLQPATLEGKLAVFYADGNSFGSRVRACRTPEALTEWETFLKTARRRFLAALLDRARSERRWQTEKDALRVEVLLWGGDELMVVVPGWCGLELASLFLDQTRDLRYPADGGERLTHACGLVFCHQQAPISRISRLAKDLAECGKTGPAADGRSSGKRRNLDTLHWMVLENFDQAGNDLNAYLQRRHPRQGMAWSPHLELSPAALDALASTLPPLKDHLPRSAMVRAARLMAEHLTRHGNADTAGALLSAHPLLRRSYQQVGRALKDLGEEATTRWVTLWAHLHPTQAPWPDTSESALTKDTSWADHITAADLAAWTTLLELWDYCPDWPSAPNSAAGGSINTPTPLGEPA